MNRRAFLGTIGAFSILPGAGRIWRAVKPDVVRGVIANVAYCYSDYELWCMKEAPLPTHATFVKWVKGKFEFELRKMTLKEATDYRDLTLGDRSIVVEIVESNHEQIFRRVGVQPGHGEERARRVGSTRIVTTFGYPNFESAS